VDAVILGKTYGAIKILYKAQILHRKKRFILKYSKNKPEHALLYILLSAEDYFNYKHEFL
jgi:hypothetical protein